MARRNPMRDEIAIVGIGSTKFGRDSGGISAASLACEAAINAIRDAGVARNEIDYKRPIVGMGQVRARICIEKLGRTSLTFGFRLLPLDEDNEYARGKRVVVRVDPKSKRPTPWTDEFRAAIAPYRADLEGDT